MIKTQSLYVCIYTLYRNIYVAPVSVGEVGILAAPSVLSGAHAHAEPAFGLGLLKYT